MRRNFPSIRALAMLLILVTAARILAAPPTAEERRQLRDIAARNQAAVEQFGSFTCGFKIDMSRSAMWKEYEREGQYWRLGEWSRVSVLHPSAGVTHRFRTPLALTKTFPEAQKPSVHIMPASRDGGMFDDAWTEALLTPKVYFGPDDEHVRKGETLWDVCVHYEHLFSGLRRTTLDGRDVVEFRFRHSKPNNHEYVFYVDPARNYLLTKFVNRQIDGLPVLPSPFPKSNEERVVRAFAEVEPGVFFPSEVETVRIYTADPAKPQDVVRVTYSDIRVNRVLPADTFRPDIPEGMRVTDFRHRVAFTQGKGGARLNVEETAEGLPTSGPNPVPEIEEDTPADPARVAKRAGPRLEVPAVVDLGDRNAGSIVSAEWEVRNPGDAPLVLEDFRRGGDTTSVEYDWNGVWAFVMDKRTIAPGASARFHVQRYLSHFPEAPADSPIRFRTNDPDRPEAVVRIRVPRVLGVKFRPTAVGLGTLALGTDGVGEADIVSTGPDPVTIREVRSSDPERFAARLVPDAKPAAGLLIRGAHLGRVRVTPVTTKARSVEGTVIVTVARAGGTPVTATLPVTGVVLPAVSVAPAELRFPRRSDSGPVYAATCICRSHDLEAFDLATTELPSDVRVTIEALAENPGMKRLRVEYAGPRGATAERVVRLRATGKAEAALTLTVRIDE